MTKPTTDRALLGAMLLLFVGLAWTVFDTLRERNVAAGDSAPNFRITADNGRQYTRKDFGGRVLVLNFWATWCPPCIEEIPSLSALQQQFQKDGVVVLAVSVDRNEQDYKKFLQRFPVAFQTTRDPEANIAQEYGTLKYPETYIIDSNGKVVEKLINAQDWTSPAITDRIRRLL